MKLIQLQLGINLSYLTNIEKSMDKFLIKTLSPSGFHCQNYGG